MKKIILFAIKKYQLTGGGRKWFGVECNFEPSCSSYTYQAIDKYGIISGIKLGIKRIKSCNKNDTICKCIDPLISEE